MTRKTSSDTKVCLLLSILDYTTRRYSIERKMKLSLSTGLRMDWRRTTRIREERTKFNEKNYRITKSWIGKCWTEKNCFISEEVSQLRVITMRAEIEWECCTFIEQIYENKNWNTILNLTLKFSPSIAIIERLNNFSFIFHEVDRENEWVSLNFSSQVDNTYRFDILYMIPNSKWDFFSSQFSIHRRDAIVNLKTTIFEAIKNILCSLITFDIMMTLSPLLLPQVWLFCCCDGKCNTFLTSHSSQANNNR